MQEYFKIINDAGQMPTQRDTRKFSTGIGIGQFWGNNKDDIYNLFIGIADKASLKYILPNKELLTVSDMEEYLRLSDTNNWIEKLFNEIYEKIQRTL